MARIIDRYLRYYHTYSIHNINLQFTFANIKKEEQNQECGILLVTCFLIQRQILDI